MEEMKIGQFIRDRRIELGMTQQQLADKLGITDKAVSKWERAVSYPDITILRELSAALKVSVTELLAGERERQLPGAVPPEVQEVVVDTVAYAETARKRNSGWKFWAFLTVTGGCLIAVLVLCIIDRFRFQGSLVPIQWVAYGWAVCYPLLRTEDKPIRNALIIASIGMLAWALYMGEPIMLFIVIISSAYAGVVYWAWGHYTRDRMKSLFLVVPLGVVLHIVINRLCSIHPHYWDFGTVLILAAVLLLDALGVCGALMLERVGVFRRWLER